MARADRRRTDRPRATHDTPPSGKTAAALASLLGDPSTMLMRAVFVVAAVCFLVTLARALEARITWYLAVDQFGYLQFANDLLHGKVFHDWEPARIIGRLPQPTDVLSQTYVLDQGRMYCRYSPGFPMLVAGWMALFGPDRVSFLNPTIFLIFLAVAVACQWRLSGSAWRGLVVAVLIALCPSQMYWWSLTLTRDLSAHLFGFTGLYQLIPRPKAPLTMRRAVIAGLALGFAGSIRNDAVLYLLPASLLVGLDWWRARPAGRVAMRLAGGALAGLALGLLPTLAYNAITTGNPFTPTQGMEIQQFLPTTPPAIPGATVAYPSVWKGTTMSQVSGGGLRLDHFWRTAPGEWMLIHVAYGWVLIGLAALGVVAAAVQRRETFMFAVPYTVSAFLFYSCWSRPDRRYIIGIYSMLPFLITEGVFGSVDLLRGLARRHGERVARPFAVVLGGIALGVAAADIPLPPLTQDATFLSKGVLPVFTWLLPLTIALGAFVAAARPAQRVTALLAPALAVILVGFAVVRADATRLQRAPFQGPQATLARETIRRTLEPRSVVITSEDMGRPAENIEYYGGVPAFYLTDLQRWGLTVAGASTPFILKHVRPYLLIDAGVPERASILADLAEHGFVAERVLEVPPNRNMEYFVAAPVRRNVGAELFRITHPEIEALMRKTGF